MTAMGTALAASADLWDTSMLHFTISRDAEPKLFWLALEITQLLVPTVVRWSC